jgi:hypothetical protein
LSTDDISSSLVNQDTFQSEYRCFVRERSVKLWRKEGNADLTCATSKRAKRKKMMYVDLDFSRDRTFLRAVKQLRRNPPILFWFVRGRRTVFAARETQAEDKTILDLVCSRLARSEAHGSFSLFAIKGIWNSFQRFRIFDKDTHC